MIACGPFVRGLKPTATIGGRSATKMTMNHDMTVAPESTPNSPNPVAAVPPLPRRRFQFSLATLLWLTTVVACLAALGVMYFRTKQSDAALRTAENRARGFRDEMGFLELPESTKIYVRGIGHRKGQWAWRFYLPPGRQYRLVVATGTVKDDDEFTSNHQSTRSLSPGEYVFRAHAEPIGSGKWRLRSEVFDRGMFDRGQGIVDDEIPCFDRGFVTDPADCCSEEGAVGPEDRLELLHCQIDDETDTKTPQPKQNLNGLEIWIEEGK